MNSDDYQRVCELFLKVCDLAPDAQSTALDSICGENLELRAELEAMLAVDEEGGLDSAPAAVVALAAEREDRNRGAPQVPGYEIIERLGEGGMGVVWRAIQVATRREVALKRINSAALGSERAKARFLREIEVAARLEHPGIVRVYDSGMTDGVPFYAMQLVEGVPLDQYVSDVALDRRAILELMQQVCQAVQHAHSRGLIHRDLKPANIVVSEEGQPHILDFGLATSVFDNESSWCDVSTTGQLLGTPAFMSPEQAAGQRDARDTRSDVFSLGVILYRLVLGEPPHDLSGTPLTVMKRIAESEVLRPKSKDPSIDADLDALMLKALSNDPDQRYRTAGDFGEDIRGYLAGEPLRARQATLRYIAQKRLRKYRLYVTVAAIAMSLLIMGVTGYIVSIKVEQRKTLAAERDAREQRDHARTARDLAERWATVLRVQAADRALHASSEISDAAEARRLLELCPQDYRGWAWQRLWWNSDQSQGRIGPFDADIRQMFLTPDQSRIVAVLGTYAEGKHSRIVVFDARTMDEVLTIRGHEGLIFRAGITPDGTEIYSCGRDKTIRRWNADTGQLIGATAMPADASDTTDVAFTPDGRYVIWADIERGLIVTERESGTQRVIRLTGQHGLDYRLAIAPDGKRVAWLTREWNDPLFGHLKLVDLESGSEVWQHEVLEGRNVVFKPDGKTILVNWREEIYELDVENGNHIRSWYTRHAQSISDMVLSPDGTRLATVGYWDQRVVVWDVAKALSITTFLGHSSPLYGVCFLPDGRRIVSGGDCELFPFMTMWSIEEGGESTVLARYDAPAYATISADGRSIVSLSDDRIELYDRDSRRRVWQSKLEYGLPSIGVLRVAMTGTVSDGTATIAVACGAHGQAGESPRGLLTLISGETGETLTTCELRGVPDAVEFSHSGRQLAVATWRAETKPTITLFDTSDARMDVISTRLQSDHLGEKLPVTFSPDDRTIVSLTRHRLWVLDAASGRITREQEFDEMLHDAHFLTNGNLLLAQRANRVLEISLPRFTPIRTTHTREFQIDSVAYSEAGQIMLIAKTNTEIQVFDAELDVRLLTLSVPYGSVTYAGCTPDGRTVVSSHEDGTVRLWDSK